MALPASGEHGVERLGLRDRPREPVQQEALGGVGLGEPVADDADHDLVRDQGAALHVLLRLEAHRGALGHGRAQHLTGGDVRQREVGHDAFGLGALARTGAAEKDHVALGHLVTYLRKPS